ncbi:hypothetical protein HZF24_04560 [Sedimentibacter hydroxybenzoicus DSM 7310]|uniref:Uncharacterized protein n=1 Tax=Sedimentibacter hydroxybenzoicus DSM 7310 TaxID=1123245 RepID=A0A974BHV8_SEDHY|nr:hypothetical protein [Sedimentibacter hydroxybenzoicus]NYB73408.1 hypothetical protein [Sedimentibacter hydroxybenzoicus DSM 7310]
MGKSELLREINKTLESAPVKWLERVNDVLAECIEEDIIIPIEEEMAESTFVAVTSFILDCADIQIHNADSGKVEAIGVNLTDNISLIVFPPNENINLCIDGKSILEIEPRSPILKAFKVLFTELDCYIP